MDHPPEPPIAGPELDALILEVLRRSPRPLTRSQIARRGCLERRSTDFHRRDSIAALMRRGLIQSEEVPDPDGVYHHIIVYSLAPGGP
jgi:hypothetical protein